MSLYRKKPVTVEARYLTASNGDRIALWCGGSYEFLRDRGIFDEVKTLSIPTLEGVMTASDGDYIIKGVKGEFYPCKPDIFYLTYEEA